MPLEDFKRVVEVNLFGTFNVIRLAAAEQDCCRFFGFAITVDDRGVALEVRAPHDALDVVHALFGVPA